MKYNVFETLITNADVKEIFKDASKLRNEPTGISKIFKGLSKDKIDISDLHSEWKEQGFPDDTRDIKKILTKFGFADKEINKVFSDVFGKSGTSHAEPVASPTVQKIANYAKKSNIVDELKKFMEEEYGEELGLVTKKKTTSDYIKKIFTEIVDLERTERKNLLRSQEQQSIGRYRK
jgi:hypothetical protein